MEKLKEDGLVVSKEYIHSLEKLNVLTGNGFTIAMNGYLGAKSDDYFKLSKDIDTVELIFKVYG